MKTALTNTNDCSFAIVPDVDFGHPHHLRRWDADSEYEGNLPELPNFAFYSLPADDLETKFDRNRLVNPRLSRPVRRAAVRRAKFDNFMNLRNSSVNQILISEVNDPRGNHIVFQTNCASSALADVRLNGSFEGITQHDLEAVTILSGPCLFSLNSVSASTSTGSVSLVGRTIDINDPSELVVDSRLSLYELESIERLTRYIVEFTSKMVCPVNVMLDIPHFQYYCYLLDAFGLGRITPAFLQTWFNRVDERSHLIRIEMKQLLRAQLQMAHVNPALTIGFTHGLDLLETELRDIARQSRSPKVPELIARLTVQDEMWRLATQVAKPTSFMELAKISYVVETIRYGLWNGSKQPSAVAAIENHSERRTMREAARIVSELKLTDVSTFIGLYPIERVLTNSPSTDLYYNDLGHEFTDEHGVNLSTPELMRQLFPTPTRCS